MMFPFKFRHFCHFIFPHRFNDSNNDHQYCYLYATYDKFTLDQLQYTGGDRTCSEILPVPPSTSYRPGEPGGPWTEEEMKRRAGGSSGICVKLCQTM